VRAQRSQSRGVPSKTCCNHRHRDGGGGGGPQRGLPPFWGGAGGGPPAPPQRGAPPLLGTPPPLHPCVCGCSKCYLAPLVTGCVALSPLPLPPSPPSPLHHPLPPPTFEGVVQDECFHTFQPQAAPQQLMELERITPAAFQSQAFTNDQWIIHGLFVDYQWIIHGLSIANPWIIHGLPMDNPYIIYG